MGPGDSYLYQEISEQPDALRRLLENERPIVEEIAGLVQSRSPRFIVIAARGTSDNVARYGKYLFGAANGLPVALATPSLFTRYGTPPRMAEALVIGISQSGESPDIVSVIEEGRRQGAPTLTITNKPQSPLATAAELTLYLHAGEERSIAATKSYTTALMALGMLSSAMAGDAERLQALAAVPDIVAQVLDATPSIIEAAERYRYAESCVVISRGYNYATAFEIALKLKELTYVLVEPYSSADFQHGPMALVAQGFPVISVVPEGRMAEELLDFLGQLRERAAELVVISPLDEALGMAQTPLPLPAGIPEWLSPIAAVVPGQIFSLGLTLAKGFDPDHPRGLRKVTLTR